MSWHSSGVVITVCTQPDGAKVRHLAG